MADGDVTAGEPATAHHAVLRRRHVLVGAGAAALLAACGGDDDQPAADPAGAADPPETTDTSTPESTDTSTPNDEAEDGADDGGVDGLVATSDVPVGGGVIIEAQGVVVTQPSDGEFRAFSSTCTHQGCQVGDVSDGLIRCPCHGSRFFLGDGTVENGPATQALPEVPVAVEADQVVRA